MTWPEERVVLLRRLVAQGMSGSQIGQRLDLTKNMIVGKCRRLGIRLQGDNNGGGWRTGQVLKPKPVPVVRQPVVEAVIAPPLAPVRPMPASDCKWVHGSGRPWSYCGAPVWRGAWCEHHYHRVYPRHRERVA